MTQSPRLQLRETNVLRKLPGHLPRVFPRMVFLGEFTGVHSRVSSLLVWHLHVIDMPGVVCSWGIACWQI